MPAKAGIRAGEDRRCASPAGAPAFAGATGSGGGGGLELGLGEELLGVERGHAAGAGGGDRLAVDLVHDVATGEHARDAGPRAAHLDLDIAVPVEDELVPEQFGGGGV